MKKRATEKERLIKFENTLEERKELLKARGFTDEEIEDDIDEQRIWFKVNHHFRKNVDELIAFIKDEECSSKVTAGLIPNTVSFDKADTINMFLKEVKKDEWEECKIAPYAYDENDERNTDWWAFVKFYNRNGDAICFDWNLSVSNSKEKLPAAISAADRFFFGYNEDGNPTMIFYVENLWKRVLTEEEKMMVSMMQKGVDQKNENELKN